MSTTTIRHYPLRNPLNKRGDSGLTPLFIAVLVAFVILVVLAAAGKSILTGLFHVPDEETTSTPIVLEPIQSTVSLSGGSVEPQRLLLIKLSTPEKSDSFRYGANSTNAVYFVVNNFDAVDTALAPGAALYMYNSQWLLASQARGAESDGKVFYVPQQMKLDLSITQVDFALQGNNAYVILNENYGLRVVKDNFNVIVARQSKWQIKWDASTANPMLSGVVYNEGYVDGELRGPQEVQQSFVSPSGTTLTQASTAAVQLTYFYLTR